MTDFRKEADALDANRHRLIEIINSNLDERDEARAQVTALTERAASLFDAIKHGDSEHMSWLSKAIEDHFAGREVERPRESGNGELVAALTAENAVLRETLGQAKEKLAIYRADHSGVYLGGVEYGALEKRTNAALATPNERASKILAVIQAAKDWRSTRAKVFYQTKAMYDANNDLAKAIAALDGGQA